MRPLISKFINLIGHKSKEQHMKFSEKVDYSTWRYDCLNVSNENVFSTVLGNSAHSDNDISTSTHGVITTKKRILYAEGLIADCKQNNIM